MPPAGALIIVQTSPVTLGPAEISLTPDQAPTGLAVPGAGPGRPGYIGLAIVTIPGISNVLANSVVTVMVRHGTDPTGDELGIVKWKNPTNQTDSVGVGSLVVPIPAGTQNVFAGAYVDLGAPIAGASATAPIMFALIATTSAD
jgi:hypothetical protein